MLYATCALLALIPPAPATIVVDATRQTPISPYIYGANHPDWEKLKTPFTVARQGGNRMTAYNWETNASNAGNDWRNQNDAYLGATDAPGWTVKNFLDPAQKHGAAAIVTVPTAGYVAADKGPEDDVNKTPDYLNKRFHRSLPRKPGGKFAFPPDVKDKAVYQDEFVAWLQKAKSPKTPVWFSLDNEPDIWASTHSRIVPKAPGYADIIANNMEFAAAIKAVAPDTKIFGPANYGWQGFRTFQNAPDANGRDFLDVYLTSMRSFERAGGRRLLDAVDIHWYPEARGDGVRIVMGGDKPGTAPARIQAPRSLWDPTYVEDSWIAESIGKKPIVLLPGLTKQIERNYPGTKLAITEYDFGGGKHVSGTLAQADVLGAFGRYGVWTACHWGISDDRPATLAGFRAFLNFDGQGAKFGDRGLAVSGETPAENSVYAALDAKDGKRLTAVIVNKTGIGAPTPITLKGFTPTSVRAFVADPLNPLTPKPVPARIANGGIVVDMPAMCVVTIEAKA
ncbi:MAG: glycoside hydrolase family 44 protein [Fimbriimonas sp.]